MLQGRAIALRAIPAQGRRDPRVKGRPQAGPAGTRSALDACGMPARIQRPPPTPLPATLDTKSDPLATGMCCDNCQNPPILLRVFEKNQFPPVAKATPGLPWVHAN